MQSLGSPHQHSTLRISEFNFQKNGSNNNSKQIDEDPILKDLQAHIKAENEIREIFKKKYKYFKPPILYNNLQNKNNEQRKMQCDCVGIGLSRFSPPQRLLVNPIIRDRKFQMIQQQQHHQSMSYNIIDNKNSIQLSIQKGYQNLQKMYQNTNQIKEEDETIIKDEEYSNTNYSKASTTISQTQLDNENNVQQQNKQQFVQNNNNFQSIYKGNIQLKK